MTSELERDFVGAAVPEALIGICAPGEDCRSDSECASAHRMVSDLAAGDKAAAGVASDGGATENSERVAVVPGREGEAVHVLLVPHETKVADATEPAGSGRRIPLRGMQEPRLVLEEVGEPPEEWRIGEANRRKEILETFHDLVVGQGYSKAKAAKAVGQGYVTIYRWQKAHAEKGFNGLVPATGRCGRKAIWKRLGITKDEFARIMQEVRGLNLDVNSTTKALRLYAQSDRCRPDLAEIILDANRCSKHALPPSLRSAARIEEPVKLAHRGPRALALGGAWTPRKMDVLPGDVFTADDTTPIWAWWVPWQESDEYPFGVKLLQGQFIPVLDVASQYVVSYVLIAREKSSYRASDIWHLFGHTFEEVGLPRLGWQLERGSWEANAIRGVEVEYRDKEVTMSRRVGGLRQLPTNVTEWHQERLAGAAFPKTLQTWTSFLPKSKSIEAWFNRNQSLEGTLWGCLGRDQMRAPMEKAKKLFQECERGKRDPRQHFLSGSEMAARVNGIIRHINEEPMEGEVFSGVPRVKFDQAVKDFPLYRMPEELKYLYRREWCVTQVTANYWVRCRLTDAVEGKRYSLFYANPDVFARHCGEEVAVYFDREDFEKPAQVILARTGEFLCEARYEERKGSFLDGDATGHELRRRWKEAVTSIYGTLVRHSPSRQVPAEIMARRAEVEHRISNIQPEAAVVERKPAGITLPASRSEAAVARQRDRLAQQAAIAARLRALRGEED